MNIVISYDSNDMMINGLCAALKVIYPNTVAWIPNKKPVYDMIDEIQPDLIFIGSKYINNSFISAVNNNNKDAKRIDIVVFGISHFDKINPRLICLPDNVPDTILKHIDNYKYIKISPAANVVQYWNGKHEEKYQSDILYISDTQAIDEEIIHTLSIIRQHYQLKICGKYKVALPEYIGQTTYKEESNFMASTKIAIDFNQSMLLNYGANRVFSLSNTTNLYFPKFTLKEILLQLNKYMNLAVSRETISNNSYKNILKHHTYFHRLSDILNILQLSDLAQQSLSVAAKLSSEARQ